MKTFGTIVASACILACAGMGGASAADAAEQTREVGAFTRIKNKGSFEVNVTVGAAQSVKITADSDIIDEIETEVRGDTLNLEFESNDFWKKRRNIKIMRIDITLPKLEAAMVQGSGDFVIKGVDGGDFDVEIYGAGDVELLDAVINDLHISIKGSGDVDVSGTCDRLDVEVKGSGDVEGRDMACQSGDVSVMGSGDVSANLKKSVDVSIMGSGDVAVWGKPEAVKSRTMGSGDVVIR